VPVVACTNNEHDRDSLQQVATQSIAHRPGGPPSPRAHLRGAGQPSRQGNDRGGRIGDRSDGMRERGQQLDVVSNAWGADGVLEGLAKLGLS